MADTMRKDSSVDRVLESGPPGLWQTRYLQLFLMFVGFSLAYALRVCMSVAIVAMMDSSKANSDFEDFDWHSGEDSYILSAFFWGYTVAQLPSGHIAKYWSAKNFLSIGVFTCAAFSLLTPVAAYESWGWVCFCRVLMGLFQGCVLPCMHTLLASWAPPSERARLVTLTYSGAYAGTVVSNAVSGVLAESSGGWPSIFYVFGGVSILWSIVFFFCCADSPGKHRWISEEEKTYIETSLGVVRDEKFEKRLNNTPWKEIMKSAPVWALVAAHCGQNWGFWVIISEISIYMNAILDFDISENGFKAALPYLTVLALAFPASWLSDYALKKGVRKSILRKFANTLSQWGPALALIGMCFTEKAGTDIPVLIFVIAVGANIGATCGFQMNHIDLSPNNAGILMSISNFFGALVAIVVPLIVGAIVTDTKNFSQWQIVFYLSAGVYFVCNLMFLILGSTELQWWDDPKAVASKKINARENINEIS